MITSRIYHTSVQIDGRVQVIEEHTDELGHIQYIAYLAGPKVDLEARLEERRLYLEEQIKIKAVLRGIRKL